MKRSIIDGAVIVGMVAFLISSVLMLLDRQPKLPPISKPENWTWGGTNFLNFTNMLVWGTNISITATNSTNILLQSK